MISHHLMHGSPCSWRTLRAKSMLKWPSSTTPALTNPTGIRCKSVPVLEEVLINWLTLVTSRVATSAEVRADRVVTAKVQWKGTSLPSLHLVWLNESNGLDGFFTTFFLISYQLGISFLFWFYFGWFDDFITLGRSFYLDFSSSFTPSFRCIFFVLDFGLYYFSHPCITVYLKEKLCDLFACILSDSVQWMYKCSIVHTAIGYEK